MMIWNYFIYFALAAILCWTGGAWGAWRRRPAQAYAATGLGLAVFLAYILMMWVGLERPPLRTMGETRLWYSFFLPLAGVIIYGRWRYRWILAFSALMATVFICINLFRPEIHSKTLMPALQSPWFAPHVIVYMMAYALLGASALIAFYLLFFRRQRTSGAADASPWVSGGSMDAADDLVCVGLAFMTMGMIMGALWAKEAWGHYWAWDPKETWAAVTWFAYLAYLHLRRYSPARRRVALWMLLGAFCLLQVCWWGINYLPAAQGTSIHTYSMQ